MQGESGITRGEAILKRGKLLRVWVEFVGDEIKNVKITGDFFIYPEDTVEVLEKELKGKKIKDVQGIVENVMRNCEYIGIEPKHIVEAVELAWKRRK